MSDPRTLVKSYQYIDLPGEPPEGKLWPGVNNIIVLRKHRDVVFDIKLKAGATYTLKTDQPESKYGRFYDTRRKQTTARTTFQDGEPLHIWVGRRFQGNLILSSEGKEIGRYAIKKMDCTGTCTDDPKDKPAPMIIAMGINQEAQPPVAKQPLGPVRSGAPAIWPLSAVDMSMMPKSFYSLDQFSQRDLWSCRLPVKLAPETEMASTQSVHISEVDKKSIPQELLDAVAAGGADETAIDRNKIATRNWLLGQLAGMGAFYSDNKEWIKELWSEKFRLSKVVHKNVGERWYVVFTGNPRLRKYVTAARYGVKNAKVLTMAGGAGSLGSGLNAAWEGSKGAFKKAGLVALIFTVAIDTAEWLHDYQQVDPETGKRKKDFADLLGKIGIDLAKAGLSAAIASALVGTVVALIGLTLPVSWIVVGTVIAAIGVGYVLDLIDKKTGAADSVTSWFRSIGESLKAVVEDLGRTMPNDYASYPMIFTPI
ncbi:hypothetical protein AWB79_01969 [Caballeronia hypogeia]|uniref:Uncharacterized protein n=1 Tax=Caballeronia hypogeia TaxID=1777140 RepID=A0A158A5C1_9BURK|nr:hypothetical protein [Caballeronia hypogeia]SAK53041.1 hypothetical protein AWB79_01969 [Caballeronia hypogeia]